MGDNQNSSPTRLQRLVESLRAELGDDKLVDTALSATLSADRDEARRLFEARLAYSQLSSEHQRQAHKFAVGYGSESFRRLFFLNTGAAGLVAAYAGGLFAKAAIAAHAAPFFLPIGLFGFGALAATIAGAFAYANFIHVGESFPALWSSHNFSNIAGAGWPQPAGKREAESLDEFHKRNGDDIDRTRRLSIASGILSGILFALGLMIAVYRALQ